MPERLAIAPVSRATPTERATDSCGVPDPPGVFSSLLSEAHEDRGGLGIPGRNAWLEGCRILETFSPHGRMLSKVPASGDRRTCPGTQKRLHRH